MQHNDRRIISKELVVSLIHSQFPQYANMEIRRVATDGWDNSTFRLGEQLKIRLPTAARYVPQITKEAYWLPILAQYLPLPVPQPVALGHPEFEYPFPWAIYHWLHGSIASHDQIEDLDQFAKSLADFLRSLHHAPTEHGSYGHAPTTGPDNFYRGGCLKIYHQEMLKCLRRLKSDVDIHRLRSLWEQAVDSPWEEPDVWIHGDFTHTNLLVKNGCLSGVIDFGLSATGDPACDLVIAWTFLTHSSRKVFRQSLKADDQTWYRAQGWALWKSVLTMAFSDWNSEQKKLAKQVVHAVFGSDSL
jgi:aminoglycoside phosphotransferase (APT) family kinase protein